MVLIYIRHAEKQHKNGHQNSEFSHDPKLTKNGMLNSIEKGKELVQKYGLPDLILCSPFQRTRETMYCLLSEIDIPTSLRAYSDLNISEYLGNWKGKHIDLRPETLKYSPRIDNLYKFEKRINSHVEEMRQVDHSKSVIWIVTHSFCMTKIAKNYSVYIKSEVPFLGHMVIDGNGLSTCF